MRPIPYGCYLPSWVEKRFCEWWLLISSNYKILVWKVNFQEYVLDIPTMTAILCEHWHVSLMERSLAALAFCRIPICLFSLGIFVQLNDLVPAILKKLSNTSYLHVLRMADVTRFKVEGKTACTSIHCQMSYWNLGAALTWCGKLNSDEESCSLGGVMVHQTLLFNCLNHIGMEYIYLIVLLTLLFL